MKLYCKYNDTNSGVYFVRLTSDRIVVVEKMIKVNFSGITVFSTLVGVKVKVY